MHKIIFGLLFLVSSSSVWARPVAVFSGGFGSCLVDGNTMEMKISSQIQRLMGQILRAVNETPIQIRTCFAIGSDTIYVSAPDLDIESQALSIDEFHDVVKQAAQLGGEHAPVFLWGFSHGGWAVMNLVAEVEGLNYRVLMTNDPISVEGCDEDSFMAGVIVGALQGCTEPPMDLSSQFSVIASRVNSWVNWYQTEFSLLHSGSIPQATVNVQRVLNASWWTFTGAHGAISQDEIVWGDAAGAIIGDLRRNRR